VGPGRLPRFDPVGHREAARSGHATARLAGTAVGMIENLVGYAAREEERRGKIHGSIRGGGDPRGVLEGLRGRDPAMLGPEEAAAWQAATNQLAVEVEVEAKKEMGLQYLQALDNKEGPAALGERLDMVTGGFSETLELLNPATARELAVKLDEYRNAQFVRFSDFSLKETRARKRAEAALRLDALNIGLENLAASPVSNVKGLIKQEIDGMADWLRGQGYDSDAIAREISSSKRRAAIARVMGEFERAESVSGRQKLIEKLEAEPLEDLSLRDTTSLAQALRRRVASQASAVTAEVRGLRESIDDEILSVVSAGGIPDTKLLAEARAELGALRERGASRAQLAAVGERVEAAERRILYMRAIRDLPLEGLLAERDRLAAEIGLGENVTPEDIMRLTDIKRHLESIATEKGRWKKFISPAIDAMERLQGDVKAFRRVGDAEISEVLDTVSALEFAGVPGALIQPVREDASRLLSMRDLFNDIADDNSLVLEAKVAALRKRGGGEFLDAFDKRLSAMETALKQDPLSWADEAGVITLDRDIVPAILAQDEQRLLRRRQDADKMSAHYTVPPKFLTGNEALALSAALESMPIGEQAIALGQIVSGFGKDAMIVMEQLGAGAPELAHIGGLMALDAPLPVVDAALKGRAVRAGIEDRALGEFFDMRDRRMRVLSGLTGSRAVIDVVHRIKSVGDLIYLGQGGSASGYFDASAYELALQHAAGMREIDGERFGGFVEYNGKNILLPVNVSQDGIEDIFDDMEAAEDILPLAVAQEESGEFVSYDRLPIGVVNEQRVSLKTIQKSQLISVGDGIYKLMYRDEILFAPNGRPYLIDLTRVSREIPRLHLKLSE